MPTLYLCVSQPLCIFGCRTARSWGRKPFMQVPVKEAAMNQGAEAMKGLESRAASSLGLAGDAGEPLLLTLALLNAAEVSWLMGRYEVTRYFPPRDFSFVVAFPVIQNLVTILVLAGDLG